jgi:hypothetical protein
MTHGEAIIQRLEVAIFRILIIVEQSPIVKILLTSKKILVPLQATFVALAIRWKFMK